MDRNVNKEGVLSGLPDPKIIKKIGIRTINYNFIKISLLTIVFDFV